MQRLPSQRLPPPSRTRRTQCGCEAQTVSSSSGTRRPHPRPSDRAAAEEVHLEEEVARGVADLAVVAKQSRAIFNAQGTPAAPGTRLQALLQVATSSAVRSLAAARLADPRPECLELGPRELGAQCGTALAYRAAVVAAMARAHDGDGAVGHQVFCLKQASSLGDWLLGAADRQMCQHAMDAAWMRNGLRLEPEVPPPCLVKVAAPLSVPQTVSSIAGKRSSPFLSPEESRLHSLNGDGGNVRRHLCQA